MHSTLPRRKGADPGHLDPPHPVTPPLREDLEWDPGRLDSEKSIPNMVICRRPTPDRSPWTLWPQTAPGGRRREILCLTQLGELTCDTGEHLKVANKGKNVKGDRGAERKAATRGRRTET